MWVAGIDLSEDASRLHIFSIGETQRIDRSYVPFLPRGRTTFSMRDLLGYNFLQ